MFDKALNVLTQNAPGCLLASTIKYLMDWALHFIFWMDFISSLEDLDLDTSYIFKCVASGGEEHEFEYANLHAFVSC